jgi:hypothetical protein
MGNRLLPLVRLCSAAITFLWVSRDIGVRSIDVLGYHPSPAHLRRSFGTRVPRFSDKNAACVG